MSQISKLRSCVDKSQAIGEFIDWLQSEGIELCRMTNVTESGYSERMPIIESTETLLAKHLGIDLNLLEEEKLEIYKSL